ncbi:tetratricopeptide repeat protein [Enhygromyxa salina]|nr:tetratricopeptide repeat protein [Enhygromyxa salina]
MPRLLSMRRNSSILVSLLLTVPLSACITMKSEHDELASEVMTLRKKVAERDTELVETLTQAQEQMALVEEQLAAAEKILRSNQASIGVRVDNLEFDLSDVRGTAEDSLNELAALSQNVADSRTELDERLTKVESKLNAETDIPEGKTDLLSAAERALESKDYGRARRLFRTYLSRYPSDAKEAEVRFKIGQTLFSERDYRSALGEFYWLVQNAPDSAVIHDAVYYSGLAFAKLGQCDKSLAYFNAIVKDGSEAPARYKTQAAKQIKTLDADTGKICADRRTEEDEEEEAAPAGES